MNALNYLWLLILCSVVSLAQATSLTAEQQQAKEQGKILWNQYKRFEAAKALLSPAQTGDPEAQYYLADVISYDINQQ